MIGTSPIDVVDRLLLELVDLLVERVFPNRLQRPGHPSGAPSLFSVPSQEKVEKIQEIYPPVSVGVEPIAGREDDISAHFSTKERDSTK